MNISHNISLKHLNTFGIEAIAKIYIKISAIEDLTKLYESDLLKTNIFFILGGGSNILLTKDFNGVIIHPTFKGIEVIEKNNNFAFVKVFAGEIWDDFVNFCVINNLGGLENLSLIPGNCGAAPVQNIGAFGVEIKDYLYCLEIINIETGEKRTLYNNECNFGYRTSIFKNKFKRNWLITSTTYKLRTSNFNYLLNYGTLNDELKNFDEVNLKTIRESIINIRTSKLPDPKEIGNAGSFFKNPIVNIAKAEELKSLYSDIPVYKFTESEVKLAAGWLIEKCGWKGKQIGNVGTHKNQALVLVNYGDAKGEEIISLSEDIIASVFEKFGVTIETEVNFL